MNHRKFNSFYRLTIISLFLVLLSCGKKNNSGIEHKDDLRSKFKISGDNFVPDAKGIITIPIELDKIEGVNAMAIQKSGSNLFSEQIQSKDLSLKYSYQYKITHEDPQSFKLVFNLIYSDGTKSNSVYITVINKHGFFIRNLVRVARVTGNALSSEDFPSPNNTAVKWDVGGTDLGIIWEMKAGKYGLFFGDTFGADFKPNPQKPGPNGGNWRSNVLAFSGSTNLDSGIIFSEMVTGNNSRAKELIAGHQAGLPTSIPTAAVNANGADYVHYFNTDPIIAGVRFYYSGLYRSVDEGRTWSKVESVFFSSDSKFALAGYWKKEGYVYMIGTPAYRDKPAYLARFKESDIENQNDYEYWNGDKGGWIKGDENSAAVLIPGTVGELSFLYNETFKKWIIVYGDIGHGFVSLRTANDITGPWSDVIELVSPKEYPMHYGPYLHPFSSKGNFLYFNLSMWGWYNVFLMRAEMISRE